jgi:Arc/MetJ-type ribon-helix-helix transcriptional regulator
MTHPGYGARSAMAARIVTLKLNQQQLELIDRTIARGEATDRAALVRRALREQAAKARARLEAGR